jgi:hypothetical protein
LAIPVGLSVTVLLPLTDFYAVLRAECYIYQHLSIFVMTGQTDRQADRQTDRQTDTSQEGLCTVVKSCRDVCNRCCVLREQRAEVEDTVEHEVFSCDLLQNWPFSDMSTFTSILIDCVPVQRKRNPVVCVT